MLQISKDNSLENEKSPKLPQPKDNNLALEKIESKLIEQASIWEKSLSQSEKKAILHYSTTEHAAINSILRGKIKMDLTDPLSFYTQKNKAIFISSAIKSFNLDTDLKVYRGLDKNIFSKTEPFVPEKFINKEFTDQGIMSTSLSKEHASRFGNVLLEINLKKGDPAAYISKVAVTDTEKEVLLDMDSTLLIKGMRKVSGKVIFECDYINKK